MKFCDEHWARLKAAIEERGLGGLVSKTGEEAARRFMSEDAKAFDPLMYSHNAIVSNAVGVVGLVLMVANEDGSDKCPICFLKETPCGEPGCVECVAKFEGWIQRAANDAADEAKALGLLASA